MRGGDTIVALSSGGLPSGVAVIRISGPAVRQILGDFAGGVPAPRALSLAAIGADTILDRGLVAYFPGPNSFTGEDVAELQVHGSPAGVKAIIRHLAGLPGIRLAEPGEFTRRAFENGKLDLTEAEGLGDLLASETESQRRQALARLEGGPRSRVASWRRSLLWLRAELEAQLDFSDEGDVAEDLPATFIDTLNALRQDLTSALAQIEGGRIVREGFRIALAGAPNVGKSSLLNALSMSEVAIVTAEAGTTRDVREVSLDLGGHLVTLLDLAGLRQTDSLAEEEGVRRARVAMESADLVLWMTAPDVVADEPPPIAGRDVWTVANKSDIGPRQSGISISTKTGEGLETLRARLHSHVAEQIGASAHATFSHERDRVSLEAALSAIDEAKTMLHSAEVAADLLRAATSALERLVGRIDAEAVLDELFVNFCIGK
ncbi:tRNA modification GTPase MnmE [Devosia pacifica]|uniref:tRNA modification GTPase MnmE n=1 Tax=Devosia pacifica TaxID=1335967 RepID=A0A918S618_9HYPH|nr:tRNA uridine-5-carboxymethylaminomethyl(34) synthesis GTPase MnmE [Devosia pacifica]GHA23419.1 tRNA modification GTPase MnmE [Devosia pacifica]